jgi:hypothetical protein
MQHREGDFRASFDVYGYRFALLSNVAAPFEGIRQDYAFFRTEERPGDPLVEMSEQHPDYDALPATDAVLHTPRNAVYVADGVRYLDYHGRGIAEHDRRTDRFRIRSLSHDLLYEAVYLYLLSRCGEAFDTAGLHRVHALGLAVDGRAMLVMLPMGGGKSTLGADLLKHPEVRLLSDDSPLIDRRGGVHAFPLRLGLLPGHEDEVPPEHRRVIQRMEFGPKIVVGFEYFRDRVVAQAEPGLVLVGTRSLGRECRVEPLGLFDGLKAMAPHCIVGVGLFQGVEFLLSRRPAETLALAGVAWSRLRASWRLLRRSKVFRVSLGRDRDLNARTLLALAKTR